MSVTLHTDVGDIKIEVFCERTPKTSENFLALCASDYYNGCIFHRNIKGFMVQTGDLTGTGRGGNSIWGKKFEDEYSEYLKVYPKYFRIYFFMLCLHLETDTYVVIIQVKIISKYTFFCSFSLLISDVERKYKCQF